HPVPAPCCNLVVRRDADTLPGRVLEFMQVDHLHDLVAIRRRPDDVGPVGWTRGPRATLASRLRSSARLRRADRTAIRVNELEERRACHHRRETLDGSASRGAAVWMHGHESLRLEVEMSRSNAEAAKDAKNSC